MQRYFLAMLILGLLPVASLGQVQSPQPNRQNRFQKLFQRADKNGDGQISRDEWPRRPRLFDRIDQNHDGFISREEAQTAVRQHVRNKRRVAQRIFRRMDKNSDGQISRDEWLRNPKVFDRLDSNHDGVITREELAARRRRSHAPESSEPPVVKPPQI